eukprot:TRINITY_DN5832_c0_g1_i1.p1 TRINITY_DN5832_c0_g1~~TRINITY_DN5832_c0_g1_i1.p1  ORF type:complete len:210 (-),score=19.62 TRINITY_DN5832_c0_g1_i1:20-649(-)
MKILCLSDTHGHHREISVPPSIDLVIHTGDFTKSGNKEHAIDFNEWLTTLAEDQRIPSIVVIGNHEGSRLTPPSEITKLLTTPTVLFQSEKVFSGLKFFGLMFFWPIQEGTTNPYFDQIPEDTQVLLTHGPPKGILDDGKGCPVLLKKIQEMKHLKLVVFGHIHGAHGMEVRDGVTYVNAAVCGTFEHRYEKQWEPIVVDINDVSEDVK